MASICLAICGITTRINLINRNRFYIAIKKRYRNFLDPANSRIPDINLFIKTIENGRTAPNAIPSVELSNKTLLIKGNGFTCNISHKNRTWTGTGTTEENIYQIDTLLRLLYSHFLIKNEGFLIHACGINHKNKGYLFAGKSGSGKSTLAKKSPVLNVLSDELVGLRLAGKRPLLMGTPFWGEFRKGGQPVSCVLNGIYFLNKNTFLKLTPLPPPLAMKKLLKLILFFNKGSDSIANIQRMLNSAGKYLSKQKTYQINLAKKTPYKTIIKMILNN